MKAIPSASGNVFIVWTEARGRKQLAFVKAKIQIGKFFSLSVDFFTPKTSLEFAKNRWKAIFEAVKPLLLPAR
jgi:hypothetical protein